ncbi:MAG: DNA polymerase III subunit gamma/tau [Pseudomonadota bacterium]
MTDTPDTERDDATFSMFGEAEMGAPTGNYQVLARKYRPRVFEDLIGQEAMVRTLKNAFETGRIAHAFMLTGVRGVGKTTTARLLARGLNYRTDEIDGPSIALDPPGEHCQAIMESRHPDVLELDAASRTGVADMRELLDGVRYSPVSARYKVYIIDEVHMLSTAAFNALLKTLEEPPPHVKFVFATTEIRKVPVTVLSRCQRFDLKRLETAALAEHLARICAKEEAKVDEAGLGLIARAAEGSVRDALSILDQAIVQNAGEGAVSAEQVRDMLGLGDRSRLIDLFDKAVAGDAKSAAAETEAQIQDGADPMALLKDLLDIAADVATAQAAGPDYAPPGPTDWIERTRALAQRLTPAQASRYWQLLLSGYRDAQTAPEADTAARMVVIRLAAAAGLPGPEEAVALLAGGAGAAGSAGPAAPGPSSGGPSSFQEIVALMDARREASLSLEAARSVRPVSCAPGRLVCDLAETAPPDLMRRIAQFLEEETGQAWSVERAEAGAVETLKERAARVRAEKIAAAAEHPDVKAALSLFPGAEIVEVRQEEPLEPSGAEDNVAPMKPAQRAEG